jgi:hypothetical protein
MRSSRLTTANDTSGPGTFNFSTEKQQPMLLVVTYSQAARNSLRNVCRSHEAATVRRFGRAALLRETEFGAFLALRLREKHGGDVQVERTSPLNEFEAVPDAVREAAAAYESRESPSTPYAKFAAGTTHPEPPAMQDREL